MKLSNEFVVSAPIERTWDVLLDVPRVARALPGARIEPDAADGSWRGTMKIKLGPVTTEYAGTALLQDVDEDERSAAFFVQGREERGQGSASATITSRLSQAGGGTRVVVETDLRVTGRQAQLGRGLMQDVAEALLGEFSARLERELEGTPPEERGEPGEALDVGAAAFRSVGERVVLLILGVGIGLALGRVLWGRS
jgi:carbon monoxide dehydrogenase subunit G